MKELSKNLRCIVLRNHVEIWVEQDKINNLMIEINDSKKRFIIVENELLNIADMVGVFTPQVMEDATRRKNGEWQCRYGKWHIQRTRCYCAQDKVGVCVVCGEKPSSFKKVEGGVECVTH